MRYVFGTLALVAAIIIVGYSATTLFTAAYTASAEPWQQLLNGTGAAAIVIWEATALILIGATWHRGYKPVAVLSTILLVVAMAVTLTWEMRTVIGGRADKYASREVDASKLKGIDSDMEWLRKRRETLTSKKSSPEIRKEMEWISTRIESLEKDRSASRAVKEVMPEAAWAARMFGGTEQLWNDILTALPLLFWMLARVAAAPLAVAALVGKRQEARTAPKDEEAISAPPTVSRQPEITVEAFVRPSEPEPVSPPPPPTKPTPKKEEAEPVTAGYPPKPIDKDPRFAEAKKKTSNFPKSIAAFRKQYLKDAPGKNTDGSPRHSVKGLTVWEFYNSLPGQNEVVSQSGFGKKLAKLGIKKFQKVDGVHYSEVILLREPMEQVA